MSNKGPLITYTLLDEKQVVYRFLSSISKLSISLRATYGQFLFDNMSNIYRKHTHGK